MPHFKNALLTRLDAQSKELIAVHLRTAELKHGDVLAMTHQRVERVYFPHSGTISCLVELKNGAAMETGMIGRDGQYGGGQALDQKLSLNRVTIQLPGTASVMDADQLRQAAHSLPALRKVLIDYEQFFLAQVQQTAVCNALHDIRARMCRWLLRVNHLAGPDFPLTHEFLAQMLGVRRTTVTEVAGDLQRASLMSYNRGRLRIEDLGKVRQRACECHEAVERNHDLIFAL